MPHASSHPQALTRMLDLLIRALESRPVDVEQVRALLPPILEQGGSMQARLLLTGAARAKALLQMLPPPNFWEECWPSYATNSSTLPDCGASAGVPYFSVVTPSYNQKNFIQDTVRSVLYQDFPSYEHIVMDGASTDGTVEYLQQFPHIQCISEPDRGQTHALNKALALAKGEVIAWINSDDFYLPSTFQCIHDYFTAHPEERIVTGDCLWGWEQSGRMRYIPGQERNFESLIRQWDSHVPGPQQSIFFRRSVLEKSGYPDENLNYAMDYDLWLRMAHSGFVRRYINIPVAFYRFHGQSKSGDQQDWTQFYDEWYACFLRYRTHSRLLPKARMLSVVYPVASAMNARERASLCAAITQSTAWKLRDLDVILVTDRQDIVSASVPAGSSSDALAALLPGLPSQSLPLRIVQVPRLDAEHFVRAAVDSSASFALVMPPLSPAIPYEQWFVSPLDSLLAHEEIPQSPLALRSGRLPAHPLLPPLGPMSCLAMHRRESLQNALDHT